MQKKMAKNVARGGQKREGRNSKNLSDYNVKMETKRKKSQLQELKNRQEEAQKAREEGRMRERERPERMERRRKRLEETVLRSAGPKTLKQKDHLWGEEEEGGQNGGMKAGGRLHGGM